MSSPQYQLPGRRSTPSIFPHAQLNGKSKSCPGPIAIDPGHHLQQGKSLDFHDKNDKTAATSHSEYSGQGSDQSTPSPDSMQGDATSRGTQGRDRSRPSNRRRQSNTTTPINRSSTVRPPNSPSPQAYHPPSHRTGATNDASVSANVSFQGPTIHYHSPIPPFPHTGAFYGQYTSPSQPSLGMGQSPHFSYQHSFHSPAMSDPSMSIGPQGYQRMVQPHTLYQFQRHHSEDGSNTNSASSFGGSLSGMNTSHTPIGTPGNQLSPSYMGGNPFGAIRYSSPMGTPPYSYPQQYTTTPPLYQAFGGIPYPPPQTSASDIDPQTQGGWYYVGQGQPSQPAHRPFESGQYQPSYPVQYPSLQQPQEHLRASNFGQGSNTQSLPQQHRTVDGDGAAVSPSSPSLPPTPDSHALLSNASGPPTPSKPALRREWHPRPPPQRSPWVMWVGNVPQEATQEELWTFFTNSPPKASSDDGDTDIVSSGVESIFLITRSNCAFVNFNNEQALEAAMKRFNGLPLRPDDPQCPMLVCKIRHPADDLKSGVGGQRGIGLHKQWIKDQRKLRGASSGGGSSDQGDLGNLASALGSVSFSSDDERSLRTRGKQSSSSDSYASTTSSFLADHFPIRYFILKSLSEYDLDLSVKSGLWATQKHNELVLDRAFRTAKEVYLIFSVNKSGEFYGYARMTGPIRQGEGSVSWATRTDLPSSPISSGSTQQARGKVPSDTDLLSSGKGPMFFSPDSGHLVDGSPAPIATSATDPSASGSRMAGGAGDKRAHMSAPAQIGHHHEQVERTPSLKFSLDQHERRMRRSEPAFELDPEAPLRAMRGHRLADGVPDGSRLLGSVRESQEDGEEGEEDGFKPPSTWGECFKIEWIERKKVPFHRTRHLRNTWNKGREIKISRDGTELEPSVGRRLLDEWKKLAES